MTRVSDEDLEVLKQYGAWTTDAAERMRHAKCVSHVIAELLALRKVAESAATMVDSAAEDQLNWNVAWRTLVRALREAGL